ncbi:winged helix-turn-helix domain-containing protein [Sphingomicrobium marinum]|uniref:winged helix-turn-helix domain-containing protein n=1 Tax=Sphingomicrobium marinum TaxID=1227950 RepID=UPI00223F36C1|nr:transcriptional regulator [Sphingomicrobium marinum]
MARDPIYRFGDFTFDKAQCRLQRGGTSVDLSPRYIDVLHLLVANAGDLISRDRFFEEAWSGVTVGDEALSQAIKDLRRALGDSATSPTYIETVPKRGYRFIADVSAQENDRSDPAKPARPSLSRLVLGGTLGGTAAGALGGLVYGLVAGMGNDAALIILLVMTLLTAVIAFVGSLALCLGMAAAARIARRDWLFSIGGAALGGFIIGELFHSIASSSFSIFVGRAHTDFTGGLEGAALGAAIALGARYAGGIEGRWPRPVLGGALGGALAGIALSLLGGKLMAASLAALARSFHGSTLELGFFGRFSGSDGLDPLAQAAVAGCEGLLFGAGIVSGIVLAARSAQENFTTSSPSAHSF